MTSQTAFRVGLLDPAKPAPEELRDGKGQPAAKRYNVYRNNVTHSLIQALSRAFPLVLQRVGPDKFHTIAADFVRRHPPSSPLMFLYGAEFPVFIQSLDVAHQVPYLPDSARLDLALRQSYHAADVPLLTAEHVKAMPAETLATLCFPPAPATRVIRSDGPIYDIWARVVQHRSEPSDGAPQDVMVTRAVFDPEPVKLPAGGAHWLEALANGAGFEAAHEATLAACPDFDFAKMLTLALHYGALENTTLKD